MAEPGEGPPQLFGKNVGKVRQNSIQQEIHPHDLSERKKNLARTRSKDASPPRNPPRREGTVIHADSILVHPAPALRHPVESFRDGRTPYLPAGSLIQARVGWYRLLEDVGLIMPDDHEFKRRLKEKFEKRRILNEEPDEYEFYQANIPALPIEVEEFDQYRLIDFKNLFRDRLYVGRISEREKRTIPRIGEYETLTPNGMDLERGFIPILTNPSFFMRDRFPSVAPASNPADPVLF